MGELIENVKQSLDENDNKVKEIEERVDQFIREQKEQNEQRAQPEPTSAPAFRQYQRKEDESFGNIFSTQYPVQREAPIMPPYVQENPFTGMMHSNTSGYPGAQENPYSTGVKMDNEFIPSMKPSIPEWGASYPSPMYSHTRPVDTQVFSHAYVDPAIETKEKMMKALDYFLKNNVDCLFNSSEQVFLFMQGKIVLSNLFRINMEVSSR